MAEGGTTAPALACWNDERRRQAMDRFAVLRPHLEDGVPLSHAADHAGVALRTAERWLSRYRRNGLEGSVAKNSVMRIFGVGLTIDGVDDGRRVQVAALCR